MLRHQNGRRSPTSSSDSPLHLGPEYEDGEAPATATEERETGESRGGDNPVEERQRRSRHDLALSPETLGTHPKIDLVTGSGRNPVKTREGEAKRRERIGYGGAKWGWRPTGRGPPSATGEDTEEGRRGEGAWGKREPREKYFLSPLSLRVHIFFGLSSNATSSSSFNMIVPGVVLS
ncbi:hypothetical protein YC2023_094108 [Brassica napus]